MQINHRERIQAVSHKHGEQPPTNDRVLQLLECINSGQAEPEQLVQNFEAGELNDNKEQK
ncbi:MULTISPECIES: hypothetical protein [unclassified Polaromonas]|jgi:hypothetical protein|uniref:hypothetical protein n=1 Tax=unclassified Polaromonas TaxID=2638319 RepID=UPI000BC7A304|nr:MULTISPECIES: hypothetical protein [unclassified Polaromonas]OYY34746.1 MAG: hypothetical protein B7Y60_14995 [Polaromonas sp. 35-63-35]OYZ19369.1 MAG: hypothetical protein B7Y28_12595 [Polaromonas sp. 16-63-31]OYZ77506.1 MAG: hypothetical protein B7Y09_16145 [Polaromonas sp. 24-63-21]OZA48510.1 MAG: hypothetical protein B7X88_18365 [Polaromonas sp. 17-63-33]OZA87260.1 MAG: hypothetical protein B7X65_13845 [Polaromonas sp. 39-63-25]